jgi:nucleoside-diphosphate-sugar epimerase
VAEQLVRQGHDAVCLVRQTSDTAFLRDLGVELCEGAVDVPESLAPAVRGVDAVVHCAGLVKAKSYEEFQRVHAHGTAALARAARDHAPNLARFVHVSTAGVMGPGAAGAGHRESDPPNPTTPYSKSKLEAEGALLALSDDVPITIVRPPAVYGPRDKEIFAFFQMVKWTRLAFRFGGAMKTMSLVYAEDCANACIRAILAPVASGSVYFVDDGARYSFEDMAGAIAAAFDVRLRGTPSVPEPIVRAAAFGSEMFGRLTGRAMIFKRDKLPELLIEHFAVDASAARRDLGWAPRVGFEEGARRTAAWYLERGWL